MSERPPKQPLNDPEYTVPEYSVLLPSDEAKNSTVESSTAEDNVPGDSAPRAHHYRQSGGDRRIQRYRLRTCGLGTIEGSAQRQAVHHRDHYSVAFQHYPTLPVLR